MTKAMVVLAGAHSFSGAQTPTSIDDYQVRWPMGTESENKVAMMDYLSLPPNTDLRLVRPPNLPKNETVHQIETIDGHLIEVTYAHTHQTQNAPLIVMFHDQNETRADFTNFARAMRVKGFSTLTVDLRGYGGSTKKKDGTDFLARDFQADTSTTVFRDMVFDVEAVLDWIEDENLADDDGVFLLGSVLGASIATIGGIPNSTRIEGIILISPMSNFRQINLTEEVGEIQGLPMIVLIAENDTYRRTGPRMMNKANREVRQVIVTGSDFGIKLLGQTDSVDEIDAFIKKTLAE